MGAMAALNWGCGSDGLERWLLSALAGVVRVLISTPGSKGLERKSSHGDFFFGGGGVGKGKISLAGDFAWRPRTRKGKIKRRRNERRKRRVVSQGRDAGQVILDDSGR